MKKILIGLIIGFSLISAVNAAVAVPSATLEQCASNNNPLACLEVKGKTSALATTPNPAGNETTEDDGFWSSMWKSLTGETDPEPGAYGKIATTNSIMALLAFFLNIALGLVGILMLISLIYGGYLWMTALGEQAQIEKAKKIVMYTVIGFIVILSAFAIVNTLFGFQNIASLRLRFDIINAAKSLF